MAILKRIALVRRRPRFGRWRAVGLFLLLGIRTMVVGAVPPSPPSVEYQVKAAFLFNFAQFVEWPARAFAEPPDPLVIGILGDDPFGSYLDDLVQGEMIGRRPVTIRRYHRIEEIAACHILFISQSEAATLEKILGGLKTRSVLTVGDAEDFSRHGGMVRFVTENGKIRLRIDVEAAKAAELTISSKMLRAATIVTRSKG